MKVELRGLAEQSHLLLLPDTEEESRKIDAVFGSKITGTTGVIANITGEVRLSDGYADHYIILRPAVVKEKA